ncbi:MAG TPA: hypothetical protein IAA53_09575 [Candidatus Avoscillospira avicola]|uniref:DUF5655 domain-containing protein n=1 Tax=Candidatus Avoscillospira avicola TaxID=2840706 RepID=A0A9D1IXG2_9FIRM|nr:hypothetical protein [Candidatus Avoscillospira avicola]
MHPDELLFFDKMPAMLPVYARLREQLEAAYPDLGIRVGKSQISFRNRYGFAAASLPWRRVKGWPAEYLLVTFGLARRLDDPRIAQAVEPYPNRWTHHVLVQTPEEVDETLLRWIDEAYWFAQSK